MAEHPDDAIMRRLERQGLVAMEQHRALEAETWIYVTRDSVDGRAINAAGFYPSEADALLAAATDGDTEAIHEPIPLWILNTYEGGPRRAD